MNRNAKKKLEEKKSISEKPCYYEVIRNYTELNEILVKTTIFNKQVKIVPVKMLLNKSGF